MKILVLFCLSIAAIVGRVLVPTQLDTSPTSLYKDVAHLFIGYLVAAGWYDKKHRLLLWGTTVILSAFELFAVLYLH